MLIINKDENNCDKLLELLEYLDIKDYEEYEVDNISYIFKKPLKEKVKLKGKAKSKISKKKNNNKKYLDKKDFDWLFGKYQIFIKYF